MLRVAHGRHVCRNVCRNVLHKVATRVSQPASQRDAQGRSMFVSSHRVHNLRDLGGLPTTDGKVTRSGVFFRSAKPDEATPEDLQAPQPALPVGTT